MTTDELMPAVLPPDETLPPGELEAAIDAHEAAVVEDQEEGDSVYRVVLKDGRRFECRYRAWTPNISRRARPILRTLGFDGPVDLVAGISGAGELDQIQAMIVMAQLEVGLPTDLVELTVDEVVFAESGFFRVKAELPQA